MHIKQFLVLPRLPKRLAALQEMAHNLWYSWNWDLVKLFIRLDPEIWEKCCQNPVEMLSRLPQETLERASKDDAFLARLDRVHEKYRDYIKTKKWFHYKYGKFEQETVAYFSLEYGLDTGLPVYSGGLGVLSGDTLKSASDLGIPMVAVGLLYRYGYFRQFLSADGWQQERYQENDWYHMPVQLVKNERGEPLMVSVDIAGRPVQIQIWKVAVGIVPLYLLDTNIPENSSSARDITSVLYGGDRDMRIRQEIVLGIGGVRALTALQLSPAAYHINEGHSWFLSVERIRRLMNEEQLSFAEASQYVWSTTIFTTHTPVPAGNERFDPVQVRRYLGDIVSLLSISWSEFISLGRVFPEDESEEFCMTVAALKMSAFANGVSELHGKVSREMWHNIWPGLPRTEIPIKSVTNGVHPASWISHDMKELYESYLGPRYVERPGAPEVWERVWKIPDAELWRIHNRRRERLIFFARKRLKQQLHRQGASQTEIVQAEQLLDPQVLTIGFARRFSTYKRGGLVFTDLDRLAGIVNNEKGPVQILFSGKAHPLDQPGKEIIKKLIGKISSDRFRTRILFLEDYDINVARYMVQGVDIWLNNPRRPQEASGTSGMKAAVNGALNLSILDGWWCEGYNSDTGFKIGSGEEYENLEVMDRLESEMLYNALEREVVPLFYERDKNGLPAAWIAKMKASIHMAGRDFAAQRMVRDYVDKFYIRALESGARLRADSHALTRQLTDWISRVSGSWDGVAIKEVIIEEPSESLQVGQKLPVVIKAYLGDITPQDISVEVISGRLNSQEEILDQAPKSTTLFTNNGDGPSREGIYTFAGEVTCSESGRFGITARIVPRNEDMPHTLKPKMISWW